MQTIEVKKSDLYYGFDTHQNKYTIATSNQNGYSIYDLRYFKKQVFHWKYSINSIARPNIQFHYKNQLLRDTDCLSTWGNYGDINIHPITFDDETINITMDPFSINNYYKYNSYNEDNNNLLSSELSYYPNNTLAHQQYWQNPTVPFLNGVSLLSKENHNDNNKQIFEVFTYFEDGSIYKVDYEKYNVDESHNETIVNNISNEINVTDNLTNNEIELQKNAINKMVNNIPFEYAHTVDLNQFVDECIAESLKLCNIIKDEDEDEQNRNSNGISNIKLNGIINPISRYELDDDDNNNNINITEINTPPTITTQNQTILTTKSLFTNTTPDLELTQYKLPLTPNPSIDSTQSHNINTFTTKSTNLLSTHLKQSLITYQIEPNKLTQNINEIIQPTETYEKLELVWNNNEVSDATDGEVENEEEEGNYDNSIRDEEESEVNVDNRNNILPPVISSQKNKVISQVINSQKKHYNTRLSQFNNENTNNNYSSQISVVENRFKEPTMTQPLPYLSQLKLEPMSNSQPLSRATTIRKKVRKSGF
ncbi:hypothetical protein K502DRAFT_323890 [Neoconidiobolus thromboides FSU 785]|nr:hypothetical protein K502DRAFT_323890 [Neoconidiobolus thromboides FSU 785]